MNYDIGHFIVIIVQTVIFLIPVLLIVYRQGRKDQKLDEIIRDFNGLGLKVNHIEDQEYLSMMELKKQVEQINNTLITLTTWVDVIKQSIEEIKKR
jgi:hypothetical protein